MSDIKSSDDNDESGERFQFVIQPVQEVWGTEADTSLHLVLNAPEIPGNTGNIGRLCAGTNIWLHLVEPLGFALDDRYLKRAGLDYWPNVKLCVHPNFEEVEAIFSREKMYFLTKKASRIYSEASYKPGDVLVLGRETKGLDDALLERYADRAIRIPTTDKVRSLNMSNACAIVLYEALRQQSWSGLQS